MPVPPHHVRVLGLMVFKVELKSRMKGLSLPLVANVLGGVALPIGVLMEVNGDVSSVLYVDYYQPLEAFHDYLSKGLRADGHSGLSLVDCWGQGRWWQSSDKWEQMPVIGRCYKCPLALRTVGVHSPSVPALGLGGRGVSLTPSE